MIYRLVKGLVLGLFKAPSEPPPAPAGAHASVEVFRASPRFLTYRLLWLALALASVVVSFVGGMAAAIIAQEPAGVVLALALGGVSAFVLALSYFLIHLDYDLRYYVLTDRSLRVREGAWTVEEKTLTYANVQNLRVVQGPVQRLFGIRDLRVDTAGGGGLKSDGKTMGQGHNVSIAGVENAGELRDRILAYMKRQRTGSGLGDPDDELGEEACDVVAALREVSAAAHSLRAAADRLD